MKIDDTPQIEPPRVPKLALRLDEARGSVDSTASSVSSTGSSPPDSGRLRQAMSPSELLERKNTVGRFSIDVGGGLQKRNSSIYDNESLGLSRLDTMRSFRLGSSMSTGGSDVLSKISSLDRSFGRQQTASPRQHQSPQPLELNIPDLPKPPAGEPEESPPALAPEPAAQAPAVPACDDPAEASMSRSVDPVHLGSLNLGSSDSLENSSETDVGGSEGAPPPQTGTPAEERRASEADTRMRAAVGAPPLVSPSEATQVRVVRARVNTLCSAPPPPLLNATCVPPPTERNAIPLLASTSPSPPPPLPLFQVLLFPPHLSFLLVPFHDLLPAQMVKCRARRVGRS